MTYWRMQLHPDKPDEAVRHCVESLAAGYIGLDFDYHVGDLMKATREELPEHGRDYWGFAHEMKVGDVVLIIAHHFPFALAAVDGKYNYMRATDRNLGVWFRHFRKVKDVRYYADYATDARAWQRITMTDTISPLRDPNSLSFRLIDEWMSAT